MKKPSLDQLKEAFIVLDTIMEQEHLIKDTSFVRVKGYIANKICRISTGLETDLS